MKKGEGALTAENYKAAIAAFNNALSYIKNDSTAKAKLNEAKDKLKAGPGTQN